MKEVLAGEAEAYELASDVRGFFQKQIAMMLEDSRMHYVPPSWIAGAYAKVGDRGHAFEFLEKAYREKDPYLVYLKVWRDFDSLHSDPRYADLLRRIGLTQ